MSNPSTKNLPGGKSSRFGFIGNIIAELRKVVWPTRNETIKLTGLVLIVALVMGLLLGAVDYGFSFLVDKVFVP
jgi:preprotein translocase subunit SecE